MKNKDLKRRILDISYIHHTGHIGSCFTAVDILQGIYLKKKSTDPVILSSGHAGLALYVVLEKYGYGNAEELFIRHGVHPNRDSDHGIWCSTGSLGLGITIAVGMAIANKYRDVYCVCSDGESSEGSFWEALRLQTDLHLHNLHIYVNANGYSAFQKVDRLVLRERIAAFSPETKLLYTTNELFFFSELEPHYLPLTEEFYNLAKDLCS